MGSLTDAERRARRERARAATRRRRRLTVLGALSLLALVAAIVVVACARDGRGEPAIAEGGSGDGAGGGTGARSRPIALGSIPPPRAGRAEVVQRGPAEGRMVALTFDDGYCAGCVATLVRALERTGAHATLFPNGAYDAAWRPQARRIRRLVEGGQLTVGSHTFGHVSAPAVGAAAFGADLDRNERWIQQTFGITGRPYLRPPYGAYDSGTLAAAGARGYTRVVMWNGTVADSNPRSKGYILNAIRHWARPGAIILLHANYPPTVKALPQIVEILRRKRLRTATLQELIGGSPYRPAR